MGEWLAAPRSESLAAGGIVFLAWPGCVDTLGSDASSSSLSSTKQAKSPCHLGVLLSADEMVEAVYPRVRVGRLSRYRSEQGCWIWVRRPRGETRRSIQATVELSRSLAGREYDTGGMAGQVFGRLGGSLGESLPGGRRLAFCGELAASVLLGTERYRMAALPPELFRKHPACWTPPELDGCEGVWG